MSHHARWIAIGTLIVGTADAVDAVVFFGLRGATPTRIFQSIASGLLGRNAFTGGLGSAAVGLLIHFTIAFAIVLVYNLVSRKLTVLTELPFLCGTAYGIGVYCFMNLIVIPLSAIGPQRFDLGAFVNGIFIHVLGIGVPSALVAVAAQRRSLRRAVRSPT
jgi:uncharacterized membrane protein YagU involved in acid resistance